MANIFLEQYDSTERKKELGVNGRLALLVVITSGFAYARTLDYFALFTALIAVTMLAYNGYKLTLIYKKEGMK